jgi:SAM-dependent methyltransferase
VEVSSQLPLHLRIVRQLLKRLNYDSSADHSYTAADPIDPVKLKAAEDALRQLPTPDEGGRDYLEKHIPRLARTLALVPPPQSTSRVLELGCYMQITPLLNQLCGYREVRGAYYGPKGRVDHKVIGSFECDVDHFDAERDDFPYPENHFDLVIAGEIIEHMIFDPMHLVVESRRVLREGGRILVTTPNVASLASVAKTLEGKDNPQIYPYYKHPSDEPEIGHMREYTAWELGEAVKAAGFEIERLFTTCIQEYAGHYPLLRLLEEHGYSTENRGEQTWCIGIKKSALPINRYPPFIYNS